MVRYQLKSIKYDFLPNPQDSVGKIEIKITDTVDIIRCDEQEIEIEIKRSIRFMPEALFTLDVVVALINKLDTDKSYVFQDEAERNTYVENNIKHIVDGSNIIQQVSLLIGNITSNYGRIPIISPPDLIIDSE